MSWDATPTSPDIQGFWSRETDLFLVAEEEGRVVRFVFGQESTLPDEVLRKRGATRAASIEVLAVDREHRRKGVATAFLNRLFDALRSRGVDYVSLVVPGRRGWGEKTVRKARIWETCLLPCKNAVKS